MPQWPTTPGCSICQLLKLKPSTKSLHMPVHLFSFPPPPNRQSTLNPTHTHTQGDRYVSVNLTHTHTHLHLAGSATVTQVLCSPQMTSLCCMHARPPAHDTTTDRRSAPRLFSTRTTPRKPQTLTHLAVPVPSQLLVPAVGRAGLPDAQPQPWPCLCVE